MMRLFTKREIIVFGHTGLLLLTSENLRMWWKLILVQYHFEDLTEYVCEICAEVASDGTEAIPSESLTGDIELRLFEQWR